MNAPHAYGSVARSFHWLIVLFLLLQIPLAFYMVDQALGPDELGSYATHKSVGLLRSQAASFPVSFFGLFTVPTVVGVSEDFSEGMSAAHEMQGTILLVLISAHALASLHHHFIRKDGVLRSMLPQAGRGAS